MLASSGPAIARKMIKSKLRRTAQRQLAFLPSPKVSQIVAKARREERGACAVELDLFRSRSNRYMCDLSVKDKEITRLRQILTKGSTKVLNQKKEHEKELMAKDAKIKELQKKLDRDQLEWCWLKVKLTTSEVKRLERLKKTPPRRSSYDTQ